MEFRDYAATETSALLGRLLSTQADGALQQLRALREALDAAARAAETAAAAAPHAADKEVAALASKLGAAAAAEMQRVDHEAKAGLEAARADLKSLQAEHAKQSAALADARAQEEKLRAEVQRQIERADTADRDLDATIEAHKQVDAARIEAETGYRREAQAKAALETELGELRGMLDSARSEAERLSDQLESEGAQNAVMTAERESAAAECVALTAQLEAATAQFSKVNGQFEAATAQLRAVASQLDLTRTRVQELERDQASRQESYTQLEGRLAESVAAETSAREHAATVQAELDRRNGEMNRTTGELDRTTGELVRTRADLEAARAEGSALNGQAGRLASLVQASVRSVDALGHATNISDLMAFLVKELATEFPRVALFRVKENHVEGEHQLGFDMKADVAKLMIPLNVDSVITRAASSGSAEELSGADLDAATQSPFGGTPATALALPIGFQDETLAVAYIESDQTASEQGATIHAAVTGFATLLVRHTAVLLTRLSQELKMLSELRDYACMLLQEADQMYSADMEAGKSEADRRRRLQETIDCARQLYAQRSALEGPAAAALLDEQIAVQAAGSTPFARELASLAGHDQQQSRRTAAS